MKTRCFIRETTNILTDVDELRSKNADYEYVFAHQQRVFLLKDVSRCIRAIPINILWPVYKHSVVVDEAHCMLIVLDCYVTMYVTSMRNFQAIYVILKNSKVCL